MSSPAFDAPLTLDLRPSRRLRVGLLLGHGAAAVALLSLPAGWIIGGGTVLAGSFAAEWRGSGRRARLTWRADGTWEQPGAAGAARLHASTFASPWLVVLALQDGRRIRRWCLLPDMLPAIVWRRLRARLRVAGAALSHGAAG